MSEQFTAPLMNWKAEDQAEAFRIFKQRIELYFNVKSIKDEKKVPSILLAVGEEGLKRYNSWTLTEEERKQPDVIFKKFQEQLEPSQNYRICRLKLSQYVQKPDETLDQFLNRSKLLAQKCEFTQEEQNERLVELIIASTPIPEFQKELLKQPKDYKVEQALTLGRNYEASAAHIKELKTMHDPTPTTNVSYVSKTSRSCKNCGRSHRYGKGHCPASEDSCKSCGKTGHWAKFCLTTKYKKFNRRQKPKPGSPKKHENNYKAPKSVHAVEQIESECDVQGMNEQFESFTFYSIEKDTPSPENRPVNRDQAFATLNVTLEDRPGIHNFKLKVDTGAQANTLPLRTYRSMFPNNIDDKGNPKSGALRPAQNVLTAYNGTQIQCLGKTKVQCNYKNSKWLNTEFFVVDVTGPAVLGLPSCEQLNIVTLHCEINANKPQTQSFHPKNIGELKELYPDRFDRIGEFKNTYKLITDPNVPPHINAPRKTPISLKDKIKHELDQMEEQHVIRKFDEPTSWVSSLTYVTKKDGSIRVCLDPRHLNQALIRPQHTVHTVEELNHKFAGSKYSSKLDAKAGYWSVKLDPESQLLTTVQTPFGRYCFQRLPFGLSVSQDIFQREMDLILEKCPGACGIADDIVVYGSTETEHNERLFQLMEVARGNGLVFNSAKCKIKCNSIAFFGNIYTDQGIKPDPQKVKDLKSMPVPMNKNEVQQFLGLITFLSRFIKDFSSKTSVLRDLLKKDADFIWEEHHQKVLDDLKQEISDKSLLHYYDTQQPIYVHCDASIRGLGSALLQYNKNNELVPIAFASKSLTPTEQRYSCIERELLSIVFAVQRFHTYLYGRHFNVLTDHKPLLMILDKPLHSAPPRLQRMLVKLQGYNMTIEHKPGVNNQLADGLSRLPSPRNSSTIDLDIRVDFVCFSEEKIDLLQKETVQDPTLNHLRETIINGWPDTVKGLPLDIRPYWNIRDEMSVENGMILKGHRIVIPRSVQPEILKQLHVGHLGQEKTKLRAKDTVFWPNINKDIEHAVQKCATCQEHLTSQIPEPLLQHDLPTSPWKKLGADLFAFDDHQWLIVADYY